MNPPPKKLHYVTCDTWHVKHDMWHIEGDKNILIIYNYAFFLTKNITPIIYLQVPIYLVFFLLPSIKQIVVKYMPLKIPKWPYPFRSRSYRFACTTAFRKQFLVEGGRLVHGVTKSNTAYVIKTNKWKGRKVLCTHLLF